MSNVHKYSYLPYTLSAKYVQTDVCILAFNPSIPEIFYGDYTLHANV